MSTGEFGNQGWKFGWYGAMDCGMTDRSGNATINEYLRVTTAERAQKPDAEEAAAEAERLRKELEKQAREERLMRATAERIRQQASKYKHLFSFDAAKSSH